MSLTVDSADGGAGAVQETHETEQTQQTTNSTAVENPSSSQEPDESGVQNVAAQVSTEDDADPSGNPAPASQQQELSDEIQLARTRANYAGVQESSGGGDDHPAGNGASGGSGGPTAPATQETVLEQTKEVTIKRAITPSVISTAPPTEQVVIETGDGDDNVQVTQDASTGEVTVNVNGEDHKFTGNDAQNLVIRAGNGNDTINVAPGVNVNLILRGEAGDDTIQGGAGNERIEGGAGNDTIDGGAGRDYINGSTGNDKLYGGDGDDVVYGGDGDDHIMGQDGNDYVEGSRGNDTLYGNNGDDVVSGGIGDDYVSGGWGNDHLYTGQGTDRAYNISGNDTIYAQTAEDSVEPGLTDSANTVINVELTGTPGSRSIRIEGSPEFVERVEADMEFLRSSPNGRQMLAALDQSYASSRDGRADWVWPFNIGANDGNSVTIRELPIEDNGFAIPTGNTSLNTNGTSSGGTDNTILYNTQFQSDRFPAPVVVLYHEMSHAFNQTTGTSQRGTYTGPGPDGPVLDAHGNVIRLGVNNSERQAVGLDNTGRPYDFDGDPTTPNTTANPFAITENGLRTEMGLPLRNSYR
jgi:Ca2+-binding RTX toxin-like protein